MNDRNSVKLHGIAIDHGYRWIKEDFDIDLPADQLCDKDECCVCGILACPHGCEMHLWHDGCGVCDNLHARSSVCNERRCKVDLTRGIEIPGMTQIEPGLYVANGTSAPPPNGTSAPPQNGISVDAAFAAVVLTFALVGSACLAVVLLLLR